MVGLLEHVVDSVIKQWDWVVFLTLVVAIATLIWTIRSRHSPVWSLGKADSYLSSPSNRDHAYQLSSNVFLAAGFKEYLRTHDDRRYFILFCEGEIAASRVRFSITPGFLFTVMKIDDEKDGELDNPMPMVGSHYTVINPGTRFLVAVMPPRGRSINSGYLYVRWARTPARWQRDDVQAICLNLGTDLRLSCSARRQVRRTAVSVQDVFPE